MSPNRTRFEDRSIHCGCNHMVNEYTSLFFWGGGGGISFSWPRQMYRKSYFTVLEVDIGGSILTRCSSFYVVGKALLQCKRLNFSVGCYLVLKVVAKLTYLVAIIGGHVTTKLPHILRFMTKQNSIRSKALIMPLTIWNCVLSYKKKNYLSENLLVLPRNYFQNRIPR